MKDRRIRSRATIIKRVLMQCRFFVLEQQDMILEGHSLLDPQTLRPIPGTAAEAATPALNQCKALLRKISQAQRQL